MYSGRIPSSILSVSPWMVFYTIIAPYSIGFSCILDEVKKCTDFYHFGGGGGGGGGGEEERPQNTVFWGPRRIHGTLRILRRILLYFGDARNT